VTVPLSTSGAYGNLTYKVFPYDGEWVARVLDSPGWCRYLSSIEETPHEAVRILHEVVLPMAWEFLNND